MKRPSKKEIKAAVEKLKQKQEGSTEIDAGSSVKPQEQGKSSQRIRKKGI